MTKNKRMIYIYDENVEIYDKIENKSEFINKKIEELKLRVVDVPERGDFFEEKIKRIHGRSPANSRTE